MKKNNLGEKANTNGFNKNPQNINKTGANGNPISKIIKELLEKNIINFSVQITTADGEIVEKNGNINSKTDLKTLLASVIIQKAISGDFQCIKEILDRTEGKITNSIDLTTGGEKVQPIIIDWNGDPD